MTVPGLPALAPLRVAAVQAESVAGAVTRNVETAVHWVGEAAQRGARVVVLPELFLGGYDPDTWRRDEDSYVRVDDARLHPLTEAARVQSVVVLVSAALRGPPCPVVEPSPVVELVETTPPPVVELVETTISVLCIPPSPVVEPVETTPPPVVELVETTPPPVVELVVEPVETTEPDPTRAPATDTFVAYSKQHLWQAESGVFAAGVQGASLQISGWQLGLGVCYDGCFPEHARAAADAGALAYVCPSAYVVGSEHRRDLYYAARALDTGMYVVMSGLVGRCGALEFSGGTAIYDPQGRVVDRVESGSGLALGDLEVEAVEEARAINPYADDRPASLGGRTTTKICGLDRLDHR